MATREGGELDREAKAHMALAVLLRKQRPPEKRAEVRRILQSELSTAKIVEAIRRLDAEPEEAEPENLTEEDAEEGPELRAEPQEEAPRPGKGPNPFRLSMGKLKSVLKVPRIRTPFLRYLFRELPRISQFGRVSHVFSPLFLLPVLRLERSIPLFFSDSLTSWANELLTYLAPVLLVGWKYLPKREYNMLVALDRLCREITRVNFHLLNLRDQRLIDRLRTLEALVLAFHYDSESLPQTSKSLERVMSSEPELTPKTERAKLLAGRILKAEATIPSLHNLLLGLNMMKHRSYLTMQELLTRGLGELFETQSYACDPEVEARIRALAEELKTKVVKLNREWSRLHRFKELINIADSDEPDYRELAFLYDYSSSTLQARSFAEDRENIMDFAPSFFRRFESGCYPLLNGTVKLDDGNNVEVFSLRAFQNELDRLRLTASKIERATFGFRSFPYSRYLAIKRDGKGGVSTELEIIGHLDEASSALVSIGKKLEQVITASARPASTEGLAGEALRPSRPIDSALPRSSRSVSLPYAERRLADGVWLAGKSVRQALSQVTAVCLQAAFFFYDQSFVETLAAERPIHARMSSHLETVQRIADPAVYDQLVGVLLTS